MSDSITQASSNSIQDTTSTLTINSSLNEFTPFDELKVTTITFVCSLNGSINLEPAFELLPIQKIQLKVQRKNVKKIKLPHFPDIPGAILTLAYMSSRRGIIKSVSKKNFKNSILLDLSLKDKNIAIKISGNSIHITGAKHIDHVQESFKYLYEHLIKIQDELDYMNQNKQNAIQCFNWICQVLPGFEDSINPLPPIIDKLDERIVKFLTNHLSEFSNFSDFRTVLEFSLNTQTVVSRDLKIDHIQMIMANYNYDLGFEINRSEFVNQLRQDDNFNVIYDNSLRYYITVEVPYTRDESFKTIRKKSKAPKHTFLVYKSGHVTQSGPGGQLMKEVYEKFRTAVNKFKHLARKEGTESEEVTEVVNNLNLKDDSKDGDGESDDEFHQSEESESVEATELSQSPVKVQPIIKIKNLKQQLIVV